MSESNYQGRRAAPSAPEREKPAPRQKPRRTREPRRTGAVVGVVLLVIAALAAVAAAGILLVRSGTISGLLDKLSGAPSSAVGSADDSAASAEGGSAPGSASGAEVDSASGAANSAGVASATSAASSADADHQSGATDPALTGSWSFDENTVYEFAADGSGAMRLSDTDYSYSYHVDGDQLYLDFADEKITDATYTYSVSGDTLTLVGGVGTAGGTYELTR